MWVRIVVALKVAQRLAEKARMTPTLQRADSSSYYNTSVDTTSHRMFPMSLASLSSRRAVTLGAIFAVILFLFLGFNHYQALPTQLNSPGLRLSGKNHELLDDVANSTLGVSSSRTASCDMLADM